MNNLTAINPNDGQHWIPVEVTRKIGEWKEKLTNFYAHHSDLISQHSSTVFITCIFASKIFASIPAILPRSSLVLLNYTGIVHLNMSIESFKKHVDDCRHAIEARDLTGMISTAAKVFVKGTNIILICAWFTASIAALLGFSGVSLALYTSLRNLAVASWVIDTSRWTHTVGEINDYLSCRSLRRELQSIDRVHQIDRIQKIVANFLDLAKSENRLKDSDEKMMALRIIRQVENSTYTIFKEEDIHIQDDTKKAEKLFDSLVDILNEKLTSMQTNILLNGLGDISIGLGRLYPDTAIQWGTRLGMQLLYTVKMFHKKEFQEDIKHKLENDSKDS